MVDGYSGETLPYATVRYGNTTRGTVADINGVFSIPAGNAFAELHISYAGYSTLTVRRPLRDTIRLQRISGKMDEVVIRPDNEKIRRIINTAIAHKKEHDPDLFDAYKCHVYYKMDADMLPSADYKQDDSSTQQFNKFIEQRHILFGETYSKRSYRKRDKLQETILASKLSGFQKTYFTNLVTGLLPFHVYTDVIALNGINYMHPVAPGWQGKYEFSLNNELVQDGDTTFMLSYYPKKGANFNSLRGIVYINSNGYAITHITTNSADSGQERYLKMEQNYKQVDGRWFPAELNYDFIFKKYPSPKIGLRLSGHSIVDSVSFNEDDLDKYSKAYPVTLHDSIDMRTDEEWAAIRHEPLTLKEQNTYVFMDSVFEDVGVDKLMDVVGYFAVTGRVHINAVDVDLSRLYTYNAYEKTRLGLGLYTNDKLVKNLSVGGWFGYGFKDKQWKYGGSVKKYFDSRKEYWAEVAYENTYQNSGNVSIHPELDMRYYRSLLLNKVDRIVGYTATVHGRAGYLEGDVQYSLHTLKPQYSYKWGNGDAYNTKFEQQEVSLHLRYAYREKRAPLFGYYFPIATKYPVLYLNISSGNVRSLGYDVNYARVVGAVNYRTHINRWGKDIVRAEAGLLLTQNDAPLPRSFLLAANGYRLNKGYLYVYGGFVTMHPYTYYNDRYACLFYRHEFDRMLYKTKYSAPYISVIHNLLYGSLNRQNSLAGGNLGTPATGYHETGMMLNRIIRLNYLNIAYLDINAGAFYHWNGPFDWGSNGMFVAGVGLSF
ncbi:MAG: carboxypeptidase-like regulatory domain-containing protein [Chitinophagales bacterium]|nr:carboxypeptidase-like regulatory domain-containing protein [Chitinophagales bacterium]